MIIAIDGPAASGKGTLGKRIADHFGLAPPRHRPALSRRCPRRDAARRPRSTIVEAAVAAARSLDPATLDDPEPARPRRRRGCLHRCPHSRRCGPRCWQFQRDFAARPAGAVLDGRDIGTVVCPDADVKIYVTATPGGAGPAPPPGVQGRGEAVTYEAVLADIRRRDAARCRPRGVPPCGRPPTPSCWIPPIWI